MVPVSDRRKPTPETNNFRLGVTHDARTMAGGTEYVQSWRLIHQSRAQQVSSINLSAVTQLICQVFSHTDLVFKLKHVPRSKADSHMSVLYDS